MQIVPMRDLKDTVKIETMCAESKAPVFITKNGYGRLVVMDIEYFENLMNEIYLIRSVNQGIRDMDEGKVTDGKAVLDELESKYGF